ncbi:MAG: hypothetical protein U1E78_07960 [Gammaproteobacteria bacterium]
MLVIQSIRRILPLLNEYLNQKIAFLKGGVLPAGRTALAVLIEHFLAADKHGLVFADSVKVPRMYSDDVQSYCQLINAFDESGQLSWGKLMQLSAEETESVLKGQFNSKKDLSFLKAMLIFRLRHQLAQKSDQAEDALIAREEKEKDIHARQQVVKLVESRLKDIQQADITHSYGWSQSLVYFAQIESILTHFDPFDVEQSLQDPNFLPGVWSEEQLHQQVSYNILKNKLQPAIELFKTREAARALWEAEKQSDAQKESLLLAAQMAALKIDQMHQNDNVKPNVQLLQQERGVQKEKLAEQEAAFKEHNQRLQKNIADLKASMSKEAFDAEATHILNQMKDFIEHHRAPLAEPVQIEEELAESIQRLFQETSLLLQRALEATDATFQPMARVSFSVGAGAGESEEQVEALRLTFSEACKFITSQNRLNMRPSIYESAASGTGHPTLILTVHALNYIMSCAEQQAEYTLPGSQSSWGSSFASALFHPVAAVSRFMGRLFYDPKVASQKREAVSQLVTDFAMQVSYKPNKELREKHWQEALMQLDNGYSGLSVMGYSISPNQQRSLTFVQEAHRRILEAAPNTVRTHHEQRCRLGH